MIVIEDFIKASAGKAGRDVRIKSCSSAVPARLCAPAGVWMTASDWLAAKKVFCEESLTGLVKVRFELL